MKIFSVFLLLLGIALVAAQEATTQGNELAVDDELNDNVDQTTQKSIEVNPTDQSDQSTKDQQSTTTQASSEQQDTTSQKDESSSPQSTSEQTDEQATTSSTSESTSESTSQNPCPSASTEQSKQTEPPTTNKQPEETTTTTAATTTTEEPSCVEKGDFCFENDECCGTLKCNMIRCAPCVTLRHGCDDDTDCCKGLKCIQVTPIDNNKYFNDFAPIAKKFNPSKQCLREKKKGKFPGGFDWSSFIPA